MEPREAWESQYDVVIVRLWPMGSTTALGVATYGFRRAIVLAFNWLGRHATRPHYQSSTMEVYLRPAD